MRYQVSVEFSNPFIIFSGRKNPHEIQCSIKMPLLNLILLAVKKFCYFHIAATVSKERKATILTRKHSLFFDHLNWYAHIK